jgi:hypothetical protein
LVELEKTATGAHAHCASKAAYHLKGFINKKTGFEDGSFDRFVALVQGAVFRGEWKALDDRMARWF